MSFLQASNQFAAAADGVEYAYPDPSSTAPHTVVEMALDAIAFAEPPGLEQVDVPPPANR